MDFDRPQPEAIESERALLGGLIERPDQVAVISESVSPEDFFLPHHGQLYKLLVDMSARGDSIDLVTVLEQIRREDRSQEFGGVAYVSELPEQVPSTANLPFYAGNIRDMATLRGLIKTNREAMAEAYAKPRDVGALVEQVVKNLTAIGQGQGRRSWQQISLIVDEELQRIEKLSEQEGTTTGATTGFLDLDGKLAGLHPSDLLILAARPAMGKTALALNIAQNVALLEHRAVGLFSLEMSRGQLVTRMMCCEALVDAGRVRTGTLDSEDWERLIKAEQRLRATRVFIDDTPGLSIGDVRARGRRLKAEHDDLSLIVIDYLQLMKGDDARAPREQQISSISRGLKGLAKDLDCPVLALSQLNRGVESRQDKRPLVSDLRESGAIEQDADVIMFIYRDEYYNPESLDKGLAEVIIAKQRNGPTGTVKLAFQGQYARFRQLSRRRPFAVVSDSGGLVRLHRRCGPTMVRLGDTVSTRGTDPCHNLDRGAEPR